VLLAGPEGNAFALMGRARSYGQQLGLAQSVIDAVIKDMKSADYTHLVRVFARTFGVCVDIYNADGTLYDVEKD